MAANIARQLANQLKQTRNIDGLVTQFQRCKSGVGKYNIPERMVLQGLNPDRYTHEPHPYPKSGGRGVDGHVENRRVSGGKKIMYLMIDPRMPVSDSGKPIKERVLEIKEYPLYSGFIALVAKGNEKRWVLCPHGVEVGDIIESHGDIPKYAVQAKNGNSYRLGALALGSVVHNVEVEPGEGGSVAKAAGTSSVLLRKVDGMCVLRMPSGREMLVSEECMATSGRVSNIDHNQEHIGSPNRMRWLGIKQRSGKFHRKDGYNGRKQKKVKPLISYCKNVSSNHEVFNV